MTADQMPDDVIGKHIYAALMKKSKAQLIAHLCELTEKLTQATPPKSQGVDGLPKRVREAIATTKHYLEKDGNVFNGHDRDMREIIEYIEAATRQHPTPAQAQGESGKALEAVMELRGLDKYLKEYKNRKETPHFIEFIIHKIDPHLKVIEAALSHAPQGESVTVRDIYDEFGAIEGSKVLAFFQRKGLIIKRTE